MIRFLPVIFLFFPLRRVRVLHVEPIGSIRFPASVALNWLRLLSANRDDRSLWGCSAGLPMSGTQVRQLTKEGRSSDRAPTASAGCGPSALLASAYPRCREIS